MRILLAEDHRDTSEAMARLLHAAGHDVVEAETIHESESFLVSEPFDVLLCDLWLADGEAWELAGVADRHGIPAIAITGLGDRETIKHAEIAGFAAHLLKPVNFADVEKTLYEAVRSYRPKSTLC